jgi:hypothetical protein
MYNKKNVARQENIHYFILHANGTTNRYYTFAGGLFSKFSVCKLDA